MLPAAIDGLINLRLLYLNDNNISEIPAAIGALVNLRELDLSGNQVPSTSDTIIDMKARGVCVVI